MAAREQPTDTRVAVGVDAAFVGTSLFSCLLPRAPGWHTKLLSRQGTRRGCTPVKTKHDRSRGRPRV
jgi:hypothetical protein